MEKIIDIANAIRKHTEEEKEMKVVNPSMGRGYIRMNGTEQQVWLTNNEYKSTTRIIRGMNDEYHGTEASGITHTHTKDGAYTSKNTTYGSIFIDQKCGEYQIKVRGRDMKFTLLNSALYSQLNWHVSNVRMVLEGEKYKYQFKTLAEIFKAIEEDTQTLNETEENIRQQQAAAEKFKKEQEEYERRLKEAEAAEAARIQAEKEKKEEEERIRQEELAKLMEKKEKIESNLHQLEEQHRHAVRFIREQASLRLQPILDPLQNQAKFAHLYDGKTLVIDGGPGTGKTTTLIQRLKLLIDELALNDYRDNHPDFELTPAQQELVCKGDNWIFFSPTALLRLYLNDNMSYEGLTNTLSRTHVWEDYRKLLLRDYYQIAGTDMPFTFPASRIRDKKLFIGSHTDIEKQFTGFYIRYIKEMFEQIRQIETKEFAWKDTSNIIKFYCREVQAAKTLEQLIRVLLNFQNHDKLNSTEGEHSIKNITRTFSEQLTSAASLLQAHIEQDEACNHSVQVLLKEWEATPVDESEQEEEEEIEETEEEAIHLSHEQRHALNRRLKALLRLLALRKYDKKARLQEKKQRTV
ncbi:MAG: hypothetical protein LUH15_15915 [Tannerellaceae bacterium]|nr:hypothetical protein [Tannerellaceae bacterium]